MSLRITCIKKSNGDHENAYTAISSMNWVEDGSGKTGTSSRIEMYDLVVAGNEAYVKDANGNKAKLEARKTSKETKYVKTVADDVKSDNLLKLPECR
ncbi:MAG: DUF3892 domain-containing protein [Sphingobacteriales bacterium]